MANIINVVVRDAETPEDDIIVPDTGWYTSSTESNNTGSSFVAPFIGIGVISFVVLILLIIAKRKLKTSLKYFGLLSTLAVLVMGASIYGAVTNVVSASDNLISITSSDTTITVVRGAEGEETDTTYGVATATIKLNETTPLGYTIFAYTPDGNILTADTGDGEINPVTTNNSALTNNTWGIALTNKPSRYTSRRYYMEQTRRRIQSTPSCFL